jgi:SAM-dependent methyltransferase
LTEDRAMWQVTTRSLLREAHETRDSVIEHWRRLMRTGALREGTGDNGGKTMTGFKRYTEEEVLRLNALQADYFSRLVHVFDPPLPEGVAERLRQIVHSAGIMASDSVLDVGTGTGILLPLIQEHTPARIYANDLSGAMLDAVKTHYPSVTTLLGDVGDLDLRDASVDVVFINACYSNIVHKHKAFGNLRRMLRSGGRLIISHPLGRSFVAVLKQNTPFPLDDFPSAPSAAAELFRPYGFRVSLFLDEENLYILRLEFPSGDVSPAD